MKRVGGRAAYRDRITVLKSQRSKPTHAEAVPKFARDSLIHRRRVAERRLAENRQQPGTGVLGVHVNCASPQRAKRDLRGAEPGPTIDAQASRLQQLREHLGQ
jgi:hypothetical protein